MFKSQFSRTLAISLFIMLLILGFSFLLFSWGVGATYAKEGELQKNSEFQIKPGQSITYRVYFGNESETTTFVFGRKQVGIENYTRAVFANCTLAGIRGSNSTACINTDGRESDSNISLIEPEFFFFSPWMLALSENFTWFALTLNSITSEPIQRITIFVIRKETILGRDSFAVLVDEIGPYGNYTKKAWIDYEKRIIIREIGKGYELELIEAPFPLEPRGE